jgi:two-component system, cell cycle response regulator
MRILVVDDSVISRTVLLRTLTGLGHDCLEAPDGEAGWQVYLDRSPDVIISDRLMPGLDGLDLCRRIRQHESSGYTYFVLLTASSDREHMVDAMEAGADDYLVKPLDIIALRASLVAATRVTELHLRLAAQQAQLERFTTLLHADSRTDALTGIGNRMRLEEDLRALVARTSRYEHRYAIAMCDVDFFKKFNDRYGHPAGDAALRAVAGALAAGLRSGDTAYRYGGEEFVLILAGQDLPGATAALDRLRASVAELGIVHEESPAGVVTISAGLTMLDASQGDDPAGWLRPADKALYRAKAAGRNQVAVADVDGAAV